MKERGEVRDRKQGGKRASLLSPERAEGKLQGVVVMGGMGVCCLADAAGEN